MAVPGYCNIAKVWYLPPIYQAQLHLQVQLDSILALQVCLQVQPNSPGTPIYQAQWRTGALQVHLQVQPDFQVHSQVQLDVLPCCIGLLSYIASSCCAALLSCTHWRHPVI